MEPGHDSNSPDQLEMDLEEEADSSELPLFPLQVGATEPNCDYIRHGSRWALLDFSGVDNSEAIASLPASVPTHAGGDTVCGLTAI